ncbi:MAG: CARDB domain-containing protein [Candidatus Paceibacterota bacterium]
MKNYFQSKFALFLIILTIIVGGIFLVMNGQVFALDSIDPGDGGEEWPADPIDPPDGYQGLKINSLSLETGVPVSFEGIPVNVKITKPVNQTLFNNSNVPTEFLYPCPSTGCPSLATSKYTATVQYDNPVNNDRYLLAGVSINGGSVFHAGNATTKILPTAVSFVFDKLGLTVVQSSTNPNEFTIKTKLSNMELASLPAEKFLVQKEESSILGNFASSLKEEIVGKKAFALCCGSGIPGAQCCDSTGCPPSGGYSGGANCGAQPCELGEGCGTDGDVYTGIKYYYTFDYVSSGLNTWIQYYPGKNPPPNNPVKTYSVSGEHTVAIRADRIVGDVIMDSALVTQTIIVPSQSGPDLTASIVTPNTAAINDSQEFSSTISNIGTESTGSTPASFSNFFQISTNGGATFTDLSSVTMTTPIDAGTSKTAKKSYTFSSTGTYYIRACADKTSSAGGGVVTESNENNNCSGSWTEVVVGVPAPDLTASIPAPSTAAVGVAQPYYSDISNNGNVSASGTITHLFEYDDDADHASGVTYGTTQSTNTITSGAPVTVSNSHSFSTVGTKYVRACADNNISFVGTITESNENNNCSGSWATVVVSNPAPDLTVSAPIPTQVTIKVGATKTFTSTISNIGNVSTGASFFDFFQIASAPNGGGTITDLLKSSMNSLEAGANNDISKSYKFTSIGVQSIRACADLPPQPNGTIAESNENNNCSPWTDVNVVADCSINQGNLCSVSNSCGTFEGTYGCDGITCSAVLPPEDTCVGTCTFPSVWNGTKCIKKPSFIED